MEITSAMPIELRGNGNAAVLLLHGFTGSPAVFAEVAHDLRSLTDATVFAPRLPGHGTTVEDMRTTTWEQWRASYVDAARRLVSEFERVIVCGLSMGGALALEVALAVPEVHRAVLVNPAMYVDSPLAPLTPLLKYIVRDIPAIGGDIAKPDRDEGAYPRTPVASIAQLHRGLELLRRRIWDVQVPVDLLISSTDHVVGPRSTRFLRGALPTLESTTVMRHSFHVATLDFDEPVIVAALIAALGREEVDHERL